MLPGTFPRGNEFLCGPRSGTGSSRNFDMAAAAISRRVTSPVAPVRRVRRARALGARACSKLGALVRHAAALLLDHNSHDASMRVGPADGR